MDDLPRGVVVGSTVGGTGLVAAAMIIFSKYAVLILLAVLIILVLVIGLFLFFRYQDKRREKVGEGTLADQGGTPKALSQAGERAKLDDVRRRFREGMAIMKKNRVNVYQLPWYLVVGEPGGGKTMAIKAKLESGGGAPDGLNDPFQGFGGTVNMNWWFTNDAVILDTAGRLMFEGVEAGGTQEFQTFLNMLRRSRPACPINGLLLVIPADSLLSDSPEKLQEKVARLGQRLGKIQAALDGIRFPVYIVITKSDLLVGFREFFDSLKDPLMQHQMLGWSNPIPVKDYDQAPFNPRAIKEHLDSVVSALRHHRLTLLQEARWRGSNVPAQERVAALYSFPESFQDITARLQVYLERLFNNKVSVWGGKPLFLRGIYFTSALQQGAELDVLLSKMLGSTKLLKARERGVDGSSRAGLGEDMGQSGVFIPESLKEVTRAYFLEDLFNKKVFQERGLVTWDLDVRKALLKRKLTVLGVSLAAVVLLILLTVHSAMSLEASIGQHRDYWQAAAAEANWHPIGTTYRWRPVVDRKSANGTVEYFGGSDTTPGNSPIYVLAAPYSTSKFLGTLSAMNKTPIRVPWVFWLAGAPNFGVKRDDALRTLFDASVLYPALDAALDELRTVSTAQAPAPPWTASHTQVLADLGRLETTDLAKAANPPTTGLPLDISALLDVALTNAPARTRYAADPTSGNFRNIFSDLYPAATWPPPALQWHDAFAASGPFGRGTLRFVEDQGAAQAGRVNNVRALEDLRRGLALLDEMRKKFKPLPAMEQSLPRDGMDIQKPIEEMDVYKDRRKEWLEAAGKLQEAWAAVNWPASASADSAAPKPDAPAPKAADAPAAPKTDAECLQAVLTGLRTKTAATFAAESLAQRKALRENLDGALGVLGIPAAASLAGTSIPATTAPAPTGMLFLSQWRAFIMAQNVALVDRLLPGKDDDIIAQVKDASADLVLIDAFAARATAYRLATELAFGAAPEATYQMIKDVQDKQKKNKEEVDKIKAAIAKLLPGTDEVTKASLALDLWLCDLGLRRLNTAALEGYVANAPTTSAEVHAKLIPLSRKPIADIEIGTPPLVVSAKIVAKKEFSPDLAPLLPRLDVYQLLPDPRAAPATAPAITPFAPILHDERQAAAIETAAAANVKYAQQLCRTWLTDLPTDLTDVREDLAWPDFLKAIAGLTPRQVHQPVEDYCDLVDQVVNGLTTPSPERDRLQKASKRTRDFIASRDGLAEVKRLLANWSRLPADPVKAALLLNALDANGFAKDYEFHEGGNDADWATSYWDALFKAAKTSLGKAVAGGANEQLVKWKKQLPRFDHFPLAKPGLEKDDLTAADLTDAHVLVLQLEELLRTSLPPNGQKPNIPMELENRKNWELLIPAWKPVLEALDGIPAIGGKDKVPGLGSVAISLYKVSEQKSRIPNFDADSLGLYYRSMSLTQGNNNLNVVGTENQANLPLGTYKVPGADLSLNFIQFAGGNAPNVTITRPGPWAALRLLVQGDLRDAQGAAAGTIAVTSRSEDGTTYDVLLKVKDGTGHDRSLYLQFKFDKALPPLETWK